MPFEKEITKIVKYPLGEVFEAAKFCVAHMGGKVLKADLDQGMLYAQMDKKLFGDYLGDRSKLEIKFTGEINDQTEIYIFAYPLNAVGQKLMFGAREGVVETITAAFFEEVEKHLGPADK